MRFRILAICWVLLPQAAVASDFKDWRKVGGLEITRDTEQQACQLSTTYEGDGNTIVLVTYTPSTDTANFAVGNKGWSSLKEGDNPKVSVDFGVAGTWNDVSTNSFVTGNYRWLTMNFDGLDFMKDFAAANMLRITRGDVVVDKLAMTGSGAAVMATIECASGINKGIARDPFK